MNIDYRVNGLLHPSFACQYAPTKTSADGNCLWHMISICLTGSQESTIYLRCVTVFTILRY